MTSNRRLGIIFVLIAATGYAFLPIFTRSIYAVSDLNPSDIAIWRFIFAAPAVWLAITLRDRYFKKRKPPAEQLPRVKLLLMGVIYAGAALAAVFGLERVPASIFVVLFHTYPAMVVIIGLFFGRRLPLVGWVALGLTLLGAALTVPDLGMGGDLDAIGVGIALLNALIVAIYFLLIGNVLRGYQAVVRGSAWIITGALLTLLLFVPVLGLQVPPNLPTWLNLFGLSIVSAAMPILVINMGIQIIGPAQASIISNIEPVETMLLAILLLGEIILPVQWLGAALIIAGVIVLEWQPRRRAHAPQLAEEA